MLGAANPRGADDGWISGNPGRAKKASGLVVGDLVAVTGFGNNRPEGVSDFYDFARGRRLETTQPLPRTLECRPRMRLS